MKLIIYNGSPRGLKSNTKLLMDEFIKGIYNEGRYEVEVYYLAAKSQRLQGVEAYPTADKVILAFPLYTDSMPGLVKEFIEKLSVYEESDSNPDMGYVVQSGFPEPAHSRHVERYLERLTERLGAKYLGTAVKGGVEGIRIMPGWMTRKLRKNFYLLGEKFNALGALDRKIIKKLTPREQLTRRSLFLFKIMRNTNFGNFYWNSQLKENNAFEQRFASPYAQASQADMVSLLDGGE
ncbi:NAD(P)H-dependent oxidoreductase [Bacteroidota bacterium]